MVLAFSKRAKDALWGTGVALALAAALSPSASACCEAPEPMDSVYQRFNCGGTEWFLWWNSQGVDYKNRGAYATGGGE